MFSHIKKITKLLFRAGFHTTRKLSPLFFVGFLLWGATLTATLFGPAIYKSILFTSVYDDVLFVRGSDGSHGSGFPVETPDGAKYIITNHHVCTDRAGKELGLEVSNQTGKYYKTKIVKMHPTKDICVLEYVGDYDTFKLSKDIWWGMPIFALGYPSYLPVTITQGEAFAVIPVSSSRFTTNEECKSHDGDWITVKTVRDILGQKIKTETSFCRYKDYKAIQTTIPVRRGSSGGPVIDPFGAVIGVIFQQEEGHWGIAIFAEDVINLLEEI